MANTTPTNNGTDTSTAAAPAAAPLTLGDNIQGRVEGTTLILEIDLTADFGLSGSGKSTIIATSRGNVAIPGTRAKMGLNIYR